MIQQEFFIANWTFLDCILSLGSYFGLFVTLFLFLFWNKKLRRDEEPKLVAAFGEPYEHYRAVVP